MLSVDPTPEREQLGFREAVLSSFEFLQSYGLRPVEEKITFIKYESPDVFVNVYHGRASYELDVEIGNRKEPKDEVTLFEIISLTGAEGAEGFGRHTVFQVSSREGVKQFVPKLAELVKKYAAPFLRGEQSAYESLKELRSKWTIDYTKQMRVRYIREKAEAAWQQKNYGQVVELFGSMRGDLIGSESLKLAYAEKHILLSVGNKSCGSSRKETL